MGRSFCCVASVGVFLAMASAAHATIGCSVISGVDGAVSVHLYQDPDTGSEVLREIPLSDLVLYPQEEFAPTQAEGWVWVRHDITQESIWQSGIYGWLRIENILDCG